MRPFDGHDSGMTITEMMISLGISLVALSGGMALWTKYEKATTLQRAMQSSKKEESELTLTLRKIWDYRRRDNEPGVPSTGFYLQYLDGTTCTTNCPQLVAWVKRTFNGALVTDQVTVRNSCLSIASTNIANKAKLLSFSPSMNQTCGKCATGMAPFITLTGFVMGTSVKTLGAENMLFPGNYRDLKKVNLSSSLGAQVCFTQNFPTDPLSVDLRNIILQPDGATLKSFQSTQVFGLSNFANLKLELAP